MVFEVGEEGDCLEGFSEADFISEDAVEAIMMEGHHLVQALELVPSHDTIAKSENSHLPILQQPDRKSVV